jgi:hypothetical protein
VVRGGSFNSDGRGTYSIIRNYDSPWNNGLDIGFRVARFYSDETDREHSKPKKPDGEDTGGEAR